jgi:RNA polymerase sigma factor (sigma-70 family)
VVAVWLVQAVERHIGPSFKSLRWANELEHHTFGLEPDALRDSSALRPSAENHPNGLAPLRVHVVVVIQTQAVTSEQDEFSAFFAARYGRLVRACVLLTGRGVEGEDLAQESMARVLERWDRVSTMDDPEGYLYRTALNVHRKALRRLAVAARRQVARDPPDDPDATDRRLDLLRAIRSLPRAQREALVLVEWLGYTAEEAGRMLGIGPASVRGRLHRAREGLRQRYGGFG